MRSKKIQKNGFTLVEMLAVMFVFAVVSSIAGTILVVSLRTSNKSTALANVRSNGNYAISQLSKTIRFARTLQSPFPCIQITPTPFPITGSSVTIIGADGGQTIYKCTGPSDSPANTITSNGASLMDTSSVVLAPGSCTFTCSQQYNSDYPLIGITFGLNSASNGFQENKASATAIQFSTSILMRNINR